MDSKIQWKEGVGGKRGIVGMQDCTSLRQSNYPMGRWFLLMRRLTFSCNPIPSNAMWCVWLASAMALRGHGPPGHLLLACSILGIVYFSSVCSFLPLSPSFFSHFAPSPSMSLLLFPFPLLCIWLSGIHFQLEEDALVFFCETKPLTGDSWGVTQNHPFSPLTQTVSIPAPFRGHKGKRQQKLSAVSITQLYMLLCVMVIVAEGVFKKQ